MNADKIVISHFDFLTINSLEIKRTVGEHAEAKISGCISDADAESYKWKVLENLWVTITAEDESGERKVLMRGMIAGFSFEPQPHAVFLTLILKSGTYLMDTRTHFRTFQNHTMTYWDVLNEIKHPYGEAGIIGEQCLETTRIDFLMQYKETDWAFIKRISSYFGLPVTPAMEREGVFYYIGDRNYAVYSLPASINYRVRKHAGAFMEQGANGLGSSFEQDYLEYEVTLREVYDLWDEVMIGNQGGYVCRIHSKYRQGELIHTYSLRPPSAMGVMRLCNDCQSGCSFLATVKAVMQDQVQITLNGDENGNQSITRWFPYSTGYSSPDGAGWYCMPEIGDQVRLQVPDSMEEHAYVISAVHLKTGMERKNPEHKSFKTKYGKELLFTPTSLELTNNQGMSIKIADDKGISIVSDKDISIVSKGNMTLSSQDASLIVAGTKSVDIRQAGTGLHMEEEITFSGGKFRIQ